MPFRCEQVTRQYVESREGHGCFPWCYRWSFPSLKVIDVTKSGVHLPLLRSCTLGCSEHHCYKFVTYSGTIASLTWRAILCRSVAARGY